MSNDFADNPSVGDIHTDAGDKDWMWTGGEWQPPSCVPAPTSPTDPSNMTFVQDTAITPYDASVHFSGIVNSYTLDGTWPTGLSISTDGIISGTPTNSGSFTSLRVGAVYLQASGGTVYTGTFTVQVDTQDLGSPTLAYPLLNNLTATVGTDPTLTRAGTATVSDTYGNTITVAADTPRFQGARYADNLLSSSTQQQVTTGWSTNSGLVTLQTSTTFRVASGADQDDRAYAEDASSSYSDSDMRGRIELRVVDPADSGEKVTLAVQGAGTNTSVLGRQEITLTEAWQAFACDVASSTGLDWSSGARFCVEGPSTAATSSYDVEMRNAQLEEVSGRSNQNPSEFVSAQTVYSTANGITVGANGAISEETPGTELSTLDGLLCVAEDVDGTWPAALVNDFVVCITCTIPANDAANEQNAFGYRSAGTGSYISLLKTIDSGVNANKIRFDKNAGDDGWQTLREDTAATVGSTYSYKLRVSSSTATNGTPGITLWKDDVKQGSTNGSAVDDLTIVSQELHIGRSQGGLLPFNEAIKHFEVYEGDFTDAEVEAIVPGGGTPTPPSTYTYLEDMDTIGPPTIDTSITASTRTALAALNHPKTICVEMREFASNRATYNKYNVVAAQATSMDFLAELEDGGYDCLVGKMFTPGHQLSRVTQLSNPTRTCQSVHAIPFEGTTAATRDIVNNTNYVTKHPSGAYGVQTSSCNYGDGTGAGIYPGHWLFCEGSNLSAAVSSTTTTFPVDELGLFRINYYAMVRDTVGDNWVNCEHVKIVAKSGNTGPGNLTVERGYFSDRVAHQDNSYIAMHLTTTDNAEAWYHNMSTQCPLDGNSKTVQQATADWHGDHALDDWDGTSTTLNDVIGIFYDVDYDWLPRYTGTGYSLIADANNDGTSDDGYNTSTGENWWKKGWELYYVAVRTEHPTWLQIGGTMEAAGLKTGHQNGLQHEALTSSFQTNYYQEDLGAKESLSTHFINFEYWERRAGDGPSVSHDLFKQSSLQYDTRSWTAQRKDSPIRMGIAMMCMQDGFFCHQTQPGVGEPDMWYDEYAVNLNGSHGTYNYGEAIPKTDLTECNVAKNWLGAALEDRKRVYSTEFATANDLMPADSGHFETDVADWTPNGCTISRNTTEQLEGSGCMEISVPTSYNRNRSAADVDGPSIGTISTANEYTVCFAMKADVPAGDYRRVAAQLGWHTPDPFIVGSEWKRYVMTFRPTGTSNNFIRFNVNRDMTKLWVDSVYVFEGCADRLQREFTNGMVLLNMSENPYTFTFDDDFQYIEGAQDPTANSGANCAGSCTVPGFDARLLVRKE